MLDVNLTDQILWYANSYGTSVKHYLPQKLYGSDFPGEMKALLTT